MKNALFVLLALIFLLVPSGQATDSAVVLPPELDRVLRDYETAWAARDASGLAGLFAENGWVLSSGGSAVFGRSAIEERYQGRGGPLDLRVLDFRMAEELAIILGEYASAPEEPVSGKFTLTLVREGEGAWLILSDMDNSSWGG